MKISEIYTAVSGGHLLAGDEAYLTQIAIELLAQAEGVPVPALNMQAPAFARAYPLETPERLVFWRGATHYQAWRRTILDAQMRAAPGDTDGNSWKSLRRAARLGSQKPTSALYDLPRYLPERCQPQQVSERLILSAYERLNSPSEQKRFRAAVNSLRRMFGCDLAQRAGLLPKVKPAAIPEMRDHHAFAPMAPAISAVRTSLDRKVAVNALDYVHRLACAGGLLNGVDDTLEDLRRGLAVLPDPEDAGVPAIRPKILRIYVNSILLSIGGRDYRLSEAEQAWKDLRKAARAAGCETSYLWALSKPASKQGILPWELSPEWVQQVIAGYKINSMPALCRKGCEQFDALRGDLPPKFFPAEPLGIRRTLRRKQMPPPKAPAVIAWDDLYAEITEKARITEDYKHLWYIRREAIRAGKAPADITQRWLETLRDTRSHDRLQSLYGGVDNLRKVHGFGHLQPLRKRRQRHDGLPEKLNQELEELLAGMGAAETTSRQFKLAVGVMAECLQLEGDAGLQDICNIEVTSVDWGCQASQAKTYSGNVMQLQRYCSLSWTPDWRALQSIVVGLGNRMSQNPVPKILSWAPAPSPKDVSLEWAQQLDRDLRSTILNGPHGRADLAKTMARHVAAFDKLHDIPKVAASGLLPPRIGSVR